MPLVRTTPKDPPPRTKVWISGFEVSGMQPGGSLSLVIRYVDAHEDPPLSGAFVVDDSFIASFAGAEVQALFVQHIDTYNAMKASLYQILIDKGLEAGIVE